MWIRSHACVGPPANSTTVTALLAKPPIPDTYPEVLVVPADRAPLFPMATQLITVRRARENGLGATDAEKTFVLCRFPIHLSLSASSVLRSQTLGLVCSCEGKKGWPPLFVPV